MDTTLVLSTAQWILAELIRYSQKGIMPDDVPDQIDALTRRRYSFFEDIDGRLYSDVGNSAREIGLMVLFYKGKRMGYEELVRSIVRHGHTENNAKLAVTRLAALVDDDGNGNVHLRLGGIREAEKLIEKHKK